MKYPKTFYKYAFLNKNEVFKFFYNDFDDFEIKHLIKKLEKSVQLSYKIFNENSKEFLLCLKLSSGKIISFNIRLFDDYFEKNNLNKTISFFKDLITLIKSCKDDEILYFDEDKYVKNKNGITIVHKNNLVNTYTIFINEFNKSEMKKILEKIVFDIENILNLSLDNHSTEDLFEYITDFEE